jgi:hypothetical protein
MAARRSSYSDCIPILPWNLKDEISYNEKNDALMGQMGLSV